MTKDEFAKKLKDSLNLSSQAVASEVINKFTEIMFEALKSGEEVTLHNIGKFSIAEKPARQCRNPRTGEMMDVPAKKAVKFKISGVIKKAVNE